MSLVNNREYVLKVFDNNGRLRYVGPYPIKRGDQYFSNIDISDVLYKDLSTYLNIEIVEGCVWNYYSQMDGYKHHVLDGSGICWESLVPCGLDVTKLYKLTNEGFNKCHLLDDSSASKTLVYHIRKITKDQVCLRAAQYISSLTVARDRFLEFFEESKESSIQKKARNYLRDPSEKKKRHSLDAESLVSFLKSYDYDPEYLEEWHKYTDCLKEEENMKNNAAKKIVITNDGKVTTAKLYDGKEVVVKATSSCHDEDDFDVIRGAEIALSRLKDKTTKTPWERFRDGEFAISVPSKRIPEFLREVANHLAKHGYRWASGTPILEWNDYEAWIQEDKVTFGSTKSFFTNEIGLYVCRSYERAISLYDFLNMLED